MIRHHVERNFSFANWQGRAFRLLTVSIGFLIAMPTVNSETEWGTLLQIASKPFQVFGLALVILGAIYTRKDKKDDPE